MRLGKLTALTGVIVLAIALIGGCSSDDTTTSTTAITYGSLDDPEFVPVQEQIDEAIFDLVDNLLSGLGNMNVIPGDTESVSAELSPSGGEPEITDPDTLIAIYQNDWHYVYATHMGANYFSRIRDSVQYQVNGVVVENPTLNVSQMHVIDNWTFTNLHQDQTHTDYTGRNDFVITNLTQQSAVINGTSHVNVADDYIDTDTTMSRLYNFQYTLTNVNVARVYNQWQSGCPASGQVEMSLSYVYSWTNSQTFGGGGTNWQVTVSFSSGSATVTANDGETSWQYTLDACSGAGS